MKCPFCDQEMEEDAIQSVLDMYGFLNRHIYVSQAAQKVANGYDQMQGFFNFLFSMQRAAETVSA